MTITEVQETINNTKNSTPSDVKVGTLLFSLGLKLIASGVEILNDKGENIGEIDLIFQDDEQAILLLVEVTVQKEKTTEKAIKFFSKWSDEKNIKSLKKQLKITRSRIYKLNFNLGKDEDSGKASLSHLLKDKNNRQVGAKDLEYFETLYRNIGKWAKNDLYHFLGIEPKAITESIDAIVYEIKDQRIFVYADRVSNILKYSYVSRRRESDVGYQRMIRPTKTRNIQKTIEKGETITFPNSIILRSENRVTQEVIDSDECPKIIKINIPRSFCSFCVIDGQHRLMGFAKMEEYDRHEFSMPVVLLENIPARTEIKTFIEINSEQTKLDSNLLLLLKSGFKWEENSKEFFEKISVEIAKKLNEESELKDNIYFGSADEKKGVKITLSTLHNAIKGNNLIGDKKHLFQEKSADIEKPFEKIKELLSEIGKTFKSHKKSFFTNTGIRILFRYVQVYERNKTNAKVKKTLIESIKDLEKIMPANKLEETLKEFYGEGGANKAVEMIVDKLRESSPNYKNLETDLRKI